MQRRTFVQIAAATLVVAATSLSGSIGLAGATTGGQAPPDASRLQAESLRQARELRASLTDGQRLALVAILDRYATRLAETGARLAVAPTDAAQEPAVKMRVESASAGLDDLARIMAEVEI